MTIAIAAINHSSGHIVAVSDRMISHDGLIQARDDAVLKARKVNKKWALMFAGNADLFLSIINPARSSLWERDALSLANIQDTVLTVYTGLFDSQFTARYLTQYNIPSISAFLNIGREKFSPERFEALCNSIDEFDVGISLLGYGFDGDNVPHIFEIRNPGRIINHDLLGYAAIGSGEWMATAALNRKRMPLKLNGLIYRLLDAKFSAETAPGVGKTTALFTMNSDGTDNSLGAATNELRVIWEKTLAMPEPQEALDLISRMQSEK